MIPIVRPTLYLTWHSCFPKSQMPVLSLHIRYIESVLKHSSSIFSTLSVLSPSLFSFLFVPRSPSAPPCPGPHKSLTFLPGFLQNLPAPHLRQPTTLFPRSPQRLDTLSFPPFPCGDLLERMLAVEILEARFPSLLCFFPVSLLNCGGDLGQEAGFDACGAGRVGDEYGSQIGGREKGYGCKGGGERRGRGRGGRVVGEGGWRMWDCGDDGGGGGCRRRRTFRAGRRHHFRNIRPVFLTLHLPLPLQVPRNSGLESFRHAHPRERPQLCHPSTPQQPCEDLQIRFLVVFAGNESRIRSRPCCRKQREHLWQRR